jgi:hypothetical protein
VPLGFSGIKAEHEVSCIKVLWWWSAPQLNSKTDIKSADI